MNTKLILALAAIATVAAALIGVAAAQYANNTAPFANTANEPLCVTGDISQTPGWCVNAATGEPYWLQNGTQNANGNSENCYQNGYAYGYGYGCDEGYENQYQHQQRFGGMYERNVGGFGGCR